MVVLRFVYFYSVNLAVFILNIKLIFAYEIHICFCFFMNACDN